MKKINYLSIFILLLLSSLTFAQVPAPQNEYIVSVDTLLIDDSGSTPYVQLAATIKGSNGDGITGLTADNFRVEQPGMSPIAPILQDFETSQVGICVVLCIDASGSMRGRPMEQMQEAVCTYIDSLRPQDYVSIITFADDAVVEAPFTNDKNYLKQTVMGINASGNYSSMFYAVCQSIDELQKRGNTQERRYVVVISDGKDESLSGAYDIDDCIDNANEDNVIISTIGFTNEDPQYLQNLEAMADETGGSYNYGANDASTLSQQLVESIAVVKSQYLMTFALPAGRTSNEYSLVVRSNNFIGEDDINLSQIAPAFTCPICAKIYNTVQQKEDCVASHRNTCPHCGQEFSEPNALESHIQSQHQFECEYCDMVFPSENELNDHISSVHRICPDCGDAFDSEDELDQHILNSGHYTCSTCDSTFVSQAKLDEHSETCNAGLPIIPIIAGVLVIGAIVAGIMISKKKSSAKMEAIQAEMKEREDALKRQNEQLKEQAKVAEAQPAPNESASLPQASTNSNSPSAQQFSPSNNATMANQQTQVQQPRVPRKTQIGGANATSYSSGQLTVMAGMNPGETYNITKAQVTVGRGSNNTIVFTEGTISRNHAIIRFVAGMFQLQDNNSSNGTSVNGQRIKEVILKDGDIVRFGANTELKFQGN